MIHNIFLAIKCWVRQKEGATAIEYSLMAVAVSVAIIVVLLAIGPQLEPIFQSVVDGLTTLNG